jgi:hypothetical protein
MRFISSKDPLKKCTFVNTDEADMKITQWTLVLGMLLGALSLTMPWVATKVHGDASQQSRVVYSYLLNDAPIVSGCTINAINWKSDFSMNQYEKLLWVGRILMSMQGLEWLCVLVIYKKSQAHLSRLVFILVSFSLFFAASLAMTFFAPHLTSCHETISDIAQESFIFFPTVGVSLASIGLFFVVIRAFLIRDAASATL